MKLSANVDFEVEMPEVEWIIQASSRALKEHILYFKVSENTGDKERKAEIKFTNKESQLEDGVIINVGLYFDFYLATFLRDLIFGCGHE